MAEVSSSENETTALKSWKLSEKGFELQIVQRLPDQTRGFFLARGFNKSQANDIATQCIMQTIVKNTSKQEEAIISVKLREWRVKTAAQVRGVKLKEDWAEQWSNLAKGETAVKPSAKIAFRWATFPSEQQFDVKGDYNWGMISFGLKPGANFDLQVFWQVGEKRFSQWIRGIDCPEDK
ncbi:hypothetical protein [sulfur-oxidizing endosymbiont of Gigantopelta aegis]|uniref:hypothetical protein n=1 Tax=sulfur-oxidizing endosymbiont of Gigantopelta aegis TaxID=2794934 RepID=UPI0018DEC741|nr:hypothetical protein [sulfur-oxidizing endosymbiont of Gigantopelta aegis]